MTTSQAGQARLEHAAFVICGIGCAAAGSLIIQFGIHVDGASSIVAAAVLAFLGGAYLVYRCWRPAPVISNLCGALCIIAFSGAMAGIISLIGLRYGTPLIDARLAHLDQSLGFDTTTVVRIIANNPVVAGLLGVAYGSSSALIFVIAVLLAVTRRFQQLWTLAFVFAATVLICTAISVPITARGAFAFFDYHADLLDRLPSGAGIYHLPKFDYYRNDPHPIISFAQMQGVVTFPSFHCCLALMTIGACKGIRWLATLSFVWNVLVIISTVPVGGHYVIDLFAGAAVWLIAVRAACALTGSPAFSHQKQIGRLAAADG